MKQMSKIVSCLERKRFIVGNPVSNEEHKNCDDKCNGIFYGENPIRNIYTEKRKYQ